MAEVARAEGLRAAVLRRFVAMRRGGGIAAGLCAAFPAVRLLNP